MIEGKEALIRVHNRMSESISIHWHGILLPFTMDGVPGISFPGISPGETFTYRFPVRQNGTYWYHSQSKQQTVKVANHAAPVMHGAQETFVDVEFFGFIAGGKGFGNR